jgi:hypothetical protein
MLSEHQRPAILHPFDIDELLRTGCTRIRFQRSKTLPTLSCFHTFLEEKTFAELDRWTVAIENKDDPDDGFFRKGKKAGEDLKNVFHWSLLAAETLEGRGVIRSENDRRFMERSEELFFAYNTIAFEIARTIDLELSLPISFEAEMQNAHKDPLPYSRSKLRLGEYDAIPGTRRARAHRDRSFFSLQGGDTGGVFYTCADKEGNDKVAFPLGPDEAALIIGLKAELMTEKRLKAPWHGSDVVQNGTRSVSVFFAHANMVVPDSWKYA